MKTAFKFEPGAGAVLAFIILSVVFLSIAGVVYILLNNSSLKPRAAELASTVPACTISPSSVSVGQPLVVTGVNGLAGTITLYSTFGGSSYNLGNLPANGTATVIVPTNVSSGIYVVRVSGFGVACTPNLTISESAPPGGPTANCAVGSTGVKQFSNLSVLHSGFAAGESVRLVSTFEPPKATITLGTTNDSLSSPAGQQFWVSGDKVPVGSYRVIIVTRYPIVTFTCGVVVVVAPYYNTCDVNQDAALNSGDQLLLASNLGKVTTEKNNSKFDFNKDGVVSSGDQLILAQAIRAYPTPTKYCY